jgi:hypothetical protein
MTFEGGVVFSIPATEAARFEGFLFAFALALPAAIAAMRAA